MLEEIDVEREPNSCDAKFLIRDHLLKLFFVILAFRRIKGRFSLLIFKKKLGQISESTNETRLGFQFLKKLLINSLES